MNTISISPEILEWYAGQQSSGECGESTKRRAYDIWSHAEQILSKVENDFHLVDVVTTLKRSIDYRLHVLNSIYHFRNIPIKDKPSNLLEQLGYFGIIRPAMLKNLIKIRDRVEHEDFSPPKHNTCKDFLELSWYFLRSTDPLLKTCVNDYLLRSPEEAYWVQVDVDTINWGIEFWGWIYPSMFSKEHKDKWIQLDLKNAETRKEVRERLGLPEKDNSEIDNVAGKNPEDIFFKGLVRGPSNCLREIIQQYFSLSF